MIDLSNDPGINYIIDQIPQPFELRVSKHCNVSGYCAIICDFWSDDMDWEDASHGPDLKSAVQNAYRRFTNQPENIYEESDFK